MMWWFYQIRDNGKITAADEAFSELRVWRDLNQYGVSQANELFTLGELNITEISTQTTQTTDATGTNQGHNLGLTSLFTRTNGTTGEATSIYFQTDGQDSVINETGFTPSAAARLLPRSGNLHSTADAATNDPSFAAKLTALVSGAATMNAGNLRGAFEAMLLDWAGADGVAAGSRGAWVDSRSALNDN